MQYFISYSRKDQDFVLKLVQDLKSAGIQVWQDQKDVPPGTIWDDLTQKALEKSAGLIAVFSPDSVSSKNVKDELGYAADHKKLIVPLIYKPCQPPLRTSRLQHIDFTGDYNSALQSLFVTLQNPEQPGDKGGELQSWADTDSIVRKMNILPMNPHNSNTWLLNNGFRLIGISFILLATIFTLVTRCLSNAQYFTIYTLIGVGMALVLVNSAEKSIINAKIKNVGIYLSGGVALSFILFLTNPIGSFKADDCLISDNLTSTTVYVHGKAGKQDMILRQLGYVIMDVHGERKRSSINENGQAFFQNLKIGDSVRIEIDFSEPYKSQYPDSIYIITMEGKIYLPVSLQGLGNLRGSVLYDDQPMPDVSVKLDVRNSAIYQITGKSGEYNFSIPDSLQAKEYQIWFSKKGFKTRQFTAYPQTGKPLNIIMEK